MRKKLLKIAISHNKTTLGTLFEKTIQDTALKLCRHDLMLSLHSSSAGFSKKVFRSDITCNKVSHVSAILVFWDNIAHNI